MAILDRISFFAPGPGSRQADPLERALAEKLRLLITIARLEDENDDLAGNLARTTLQLDAAGIQITGLLLDAEGLTVRLQAQARKVCRRDADIKRLVASLESTQKMLAAARPRIYLDPEPLVSAYAPHSIPYLNGNQPLGIETTHKMRRPELHAA